MNYTTQWSPLQIILFLIALISLVLILLFIRSLFAAQERIEKLEDEYGNRYRRRIRRRHVRWQHGFGGAILLVAAFVLFGIAGAAQVYLGLTGTILVAHVRAVQATPVDSIPTMSVELVLYDQNKNKSSDTTYIVNGDEVFIQGDVVEYASWMNILGFHSGYKLTKLEGMYSDDNLERNAKHTVEVLNGGDDSLFNTAYQKGWNTFFVTGAYKNGSSVPTNGIGYNICASQDAIIARPDNESC